mgnify:FL=1
MYYRVTTFSFNPDREDDMLAVANAAADEMKAIAGLQSATIVRVGDGKTITIGAYDTEESAAAAQPKIQSILGRLGDMLTAPPEAQEGPVIFEV